LSIAIMSNKKRFAERIKKIQQISNLSLKDFAKSLGVPEKTVQNWLYGISYPKPEILEKLVLQFKANPNYILLGEGPPLLKEGVKRPFIKKKSPLKTNNVSVNATAN